MTRGEVIAAARAQVGVRFRAQGRDRDGLDCVGLTAAAFGIADPPGRYPQRGGAPDAVARLIAAAGLVPTDDPAPGDLLLCRCGPRQLHLAVLVPGGLVHACAKARRVVERPGAAPWPVLGAWRVPGLPLD